MPLTGFFTVLHQLLIQKLYDVGIQDQGLILINSRLSSRKTILEWNKTLMGPIADEQLVIAPPFWIAMCDIFGPCQIYVPGHSMLSRNKQAVDVKCYVLVFVCMVTKLVNMQVIETKKTDGVIDGINRLGCEVGIPSFVLLDQDSSIIKAFNEAEVNLKRSSTCSIQGERHKV